MSTPVHNIYVMGTNPVLDMMSVHIQAWQEKDDKRYLFLSCYAAMTGNMIKAIDAGEFHDAVWVRGLMGRFAEYYFEGLERCECGAHDRPRVWEFTHRASVSCELHVLQHLLLGINAHINYDLVLTLYEILHREWADASLETKQIRKEDHKKVNEIIAHTIDKVQDEIIEVASPVMEILDRMMGRVDEYLLSLLIRSWRSDVWKTTMQMLDDPEPGRIENLRFHLEEKVISRANGIMLR